MYWDYTLAVPLFHCIIFLHSEWEILRRKELVGTKQTIVFYLDSIIVFKCLYHNSIKVSQNAHNPLCLFMLYVFPLNISISKYIWMIIFPI